ncbi:39S ribosomal protein L46, mitochondrial-like [Limulus polyphemus]|uniref:Large ribosomal subunit protein mL46 n=1 Tax=Limulus polyphemus TaxID=6850 RepID=A0ABM1B6Q4_LIMPO|nr:39S ribosomal protein L46, mitochondrial-like [Limulus polyphemus]
MAASTVGVSRLLPYACCLRRALSSTNQRLSSIELSIQRSLSQWHLVSAVALERKPVIIKEKSPFEKKYYGMLQQMELKQSLLSDHELRIKEDINRAERIKKGEIDESDLDASSKQTAQDFEDAATEELHKFQVASRVTDADIKGDQHSLERKLDAHLLLVVKQKLGNDHRWVLPQCIRLEGETMRQAAERVLYETCGHNLKAIFLGNAPAGFYKYKYPKAARGNGILGAKVFFFKAQIRNGNVSQKAIQNNTDVEDFLWLTRQELTDKLQQDYLKTVHTFLVDDDDEVGLNYELEEESEEHRQTSRQWN